MLAMPNAGFLHAAWELGIPILSYGVEYSSESTALGSCTAGLRCVATLPPCPNSERSASFIKLSSTSQADPMLMSSLPFRSIRQQLTVGRTRSRATSCNCGPSRRQGLIGAAVLGLVGIQGNRGVAMAALAQGEAEKVRHLANSTQ